jgi:Cu/Ag efflux pump CusA
MLPSALGWSVDGSLRQGMGVAVIGGLLVATFITLFVVPAVYTLLRSAPPTAHALDEQFAAESRGASEASHA